MIHRNTNDKIFKFNYRKKWESKLLETDMYHLSWLIKKYLSSQGHHTISANSSIMNLYRLIDSAHNQYFDKYMRLILHTIFKDHNSVTKKMQNISKIQIKNRREISNQKITFAEANEILSLFDARH